VTEGARQREGKENRMIAGLARRSGGLRGLWKRLKQLDRDETGAQGLEILLIIVAIVLPLLGVLMWFRDDIKTWVKEIWDKARGRGEDVDVEQPF